MITDGIVALLRSDAGVSLLTTAIVPVGAVKGVISPVIVYHVGTTLDVLDAQGSTGYRHARFQFDIISGSSYTEAKLVAKAVRKCLQNFKNTTLSDADATFVQGCLIDFETDETLTATGQKTIDYRVVAQVSIFYKES